MQARKNTGATVSYQGQLWQMADALRGSMDAAEYKHVVQGRILLKCLSDAFEERQAQLEAERSKGAGPENPNECHAVNIFFWVPREGRREELRTRPRQSNISQFVRAGASRT
ncbi:hypothetical protein HRbin30_02246 [bacterium HR30]|nr:hypothetical protein HRbin30_02246 [bacterium HR30]